MEKNFQELNWSLVLVDYPRKLGQKECYQFKAHELHEAQASWATE